MVAAAYDLYIEQGATFLATVFSLPAPTTFTPNPYAELMGQGLVASRPTDGLIKGNLWYDVTLAATARWSRWSGTAWANVTPTDLTGWSARLMFRKKYRDASPLLSLTSPSASGLGLDLGATHGSVTIKMPATTTAALDALWENNVTGVYDLEVFDASTPVQVTRLLSGTWTLGLESTR